jgi:hypothetical protein
MLRAAKGNQVQKRHPPRPPHCQPQRGAARVARDQHCILTHTIALPLLSARRGAALVDLPGVAAAEAASAAVVTRVIAWAFKR